MKWTLTLLLALLVCSCASRVGVTVKGLSLYVSGDEGKVYIVERARGTNWIPITNFIGSGTNAAPEFIEHVPPHVQRSYRFRPE